MMTPSARLQAAIEMLELVTEMPRPADGVIGAYFRGHRYIGAKDRVAVAELVYGVLRHQARLGWWCEHYKIVPTARARMVTYLRLVGGGGLLDAAARDEQGGRSGRLQGREMDSGFRRNDAGGLGQAGARQKKEQRDSRLRGNDGNRTDEGCENSEADKKQGKWDSHERRPGVQMRGNDGKDKGTGGVKPVVREVVLAKFVARDVPLKDSDITKIFSGGKFAPDTLSMAEEKFLGQLKGHDLLHPKMGTAVRCEMPEAMLEPLQTQFGKRLETEMAALLRPAPLDLRVNQVKATRDAVVRELQDAGLRATPCRYAPFGVRLGARVALPTLPAFKEGRVEVQDEGSQLVALLVDAKPGMRVVDFCAGAGGKTLAIAAMMANKGRVTALDVLGKRLLRAEERFRRAGLHNIEARALTSESDPWIKRHKGTFDRVLVDAPCGGSGTWRRNPDARWKQLGPGLVELVPLQQRILTSAARLVKPGGRLVYATCSLLDAENVAQIEAFLAAHADFKLLPYAESWQAAGGGDLPCAGDYLRLTPAQHDTDGFFAAVMVRAAAALSPDAGEEVIPVPPRQPGG
ncbi:MAG: RsmB/NOP family class I SAM-dependent RNA methyltransferase [Alphaproteobacteria bacterium]